jgi:predicted amidophosphoribosyltransferase
MPRPPVKVCKTCEMPALFGEKYCDRCRQVVLSKMKSEGYLEDRYYQRRVSEAGTRKARDSHILSGAPEHGHDGDD